MGLTLFIVGAAIFFGAHLFTSFRKRGPGDIRARLGQTYRGLYSLISIIGFVLLIWGYARMRSGETHLWDSPGWVRHVVLAGMFPTFVILAATYAPAGYIKKWVGHPMIMAVILWSALHLAFNGDSAEALLFGAFLVYGLLDRIALAMRGDRGAAAVKPHILGDMIALSAGGGIYLAFVFGLHRLLIGVPVV